MDKFWSTNRRMIQTNLQIKDTAQIDPEKLVSQIEDLGGEVLIFNVAGIYAWYQSEVPYHHVNEYLDPAKDLLGEVIEECHRRGIRFIGRFDFNRGEDLIYQAHPEWFAQNEDGTPQVVGSMRPGEWSLLYTTCMNSGYWRDKMALPVITEALTRYPMDGVFFNGIFPADCHCDVCKGLYKEKYGVDLPRSDPDPSWRSFEIERNVSVLRDKIKELRPDIPFVLYQWTEQSRYLDAPMTEMICDESQNVLSRGLEKLSPYWLPSYKMKLCRLDSPLAPPCGIIHSSPGMDWRHTGLPPAEYRFWMSQVHAAGGSLWHSITGIPDTITDKKLLDTLKKVNLDIKASQKEMENVKPIDDLALLFEPENPSQGWLTALYDRQILFDILPVYRAEENLCRFKAVIVPEIIDISESLAAALCVYIRKGGRVLFEGKLPAHTPELFELCGISPIQKTTEYYYSSYLKPSKAFDNLDTADLENTPLLPFRGKVARSHCTAAESLANLVPSFAPLEAVGAPPERASILTKDTDIPLITENKPGSGYALYLSFSLAHLIESFELAQHFQLADTLFSRLIEDKSVKVTNYPGLTVHAYKGENNIIMHLVNGAGKRPLQKAMPLYGIDVSVTLPSDSTPVSVINLLETENLKFNADGTVLRFTVPEIKVMQSISIQIE